MSTIASVATSAAVSALMSGIVVLYNRSQVTALEAKISELSGILKKTSQLVVNLTDENTILTKKIADMDGNKVFKEQQGKHATTLTAHSNRISDLEVYMQVVIKSMLEMLPPDTLNKTEQKVLSRKIARVAKSKTIKKQKKKKKHDSSESSSSESSDESSSNESGSSSSTESSESSEEVQKKSKSKSKKNKKTKHKPVDDTVSRVRKALEDS